MLDPAKYSTRTYQGFRERAKDPTLSLNEKCGSPEMFRAGRTESIFADIAGKLTALAKRGAKVLDIGAGCSELTHHIIDMTGRNGQLLATIDSPEMLSLLPDRPHLTKIEGPFPDCTKTFGRSLGPFDAILTYGVAQAVFAEGNLFTFVDAAVQLLNEQGQFLIGDISNTTMRKRFMTSTPGKVYHQTHYSHLPEPNVVFGRLEPGEIDDGVLLGLVTRMRAAGFHAFLIPQAADLPMANRREDMLIVRP
jgi:hypothetical protein